MEPSFLYPVSTEERLILPVAHLGLTALGKALSPTFVLPQQPSPSSAGKSEEGKLSPQEFGIKPEEWREACHKLSEALHADELSTVVGLLQWVPLVVFAGPAWINIPAEKRQRAQVYTELAKLDHSIMRPRNLQMHLHAHFVHRGRSGDQWCWLSISRNEAGQQQTVLTFSGNEPEKDKKHIALCRSLYEKCETKVRTS